LTSKLKLWDAIILFLKRNFISVFLPAGAVSSLAFFSNEIEKKGITRTQVYFASSIYAFVGILSVVIVAIPAFCLLYREGAWGWGNGMPLLELSIFYCLFLFIIHFLKKGKLYDTWILKDLSLKRNSSLRI
jgi:phosphatidylglycerol lysyltransferase